MPESEHKIATKRGSICSVDPIRLGRAGQQCSDLAWASVIAKLGNVMYLWTPALQYSSPHLQDWMSMVQTIIYEA